MLSQEITNEISKNLYDQTIEQAFLGALILENRLIENVPDDFRSYCFYNILNGHIYDSIHKFYNKSSVADPITISYDLQGISDFSDIDLKKYIVDLTDSVISFGNVADYAEIIRDLYIRRCIVQISDNAISEAKKINITDHSGTKLLESVEEEFYQLSNTSYFDGRTYMFADALATSIESAANAFKKEGAIVGVPTGFVAIDQKMGGLHNSDLIIVAGRPSMGKTAFATNIAFNAAKSKLIDRNDGAGVLFFSLEMSAEQLATRILSSEANISSDNIRRGEIDKDALEKFLQISRDFEGLSLFIDDGANVSTNYIRNKIRKIKRRHDIGLVVIDYLQLISSNKRENRVQEISEITRSLKNIAKEYNIPIVALSQLSRAVEQRDDKKPQLSDLRESGSIEQDADVVMFIYREEYYKSRKEPAEGTPEHLKWQAEMEDCYNRADVIIAKQRHGPVGTIRLFFDGRLTKFGNLID